MILLSLFLAIIGIIRPEAAAWSDKFLSALPGILLLAAIITAAKYRQRHPEPMD